MYTLKLVQESDVEGLSEIMAESFTDADLEKPWDTEHAHRYLKYWFKKQPDMFFMAFNKTDEPVGAMVVNIKPWRTGIRCSDGVLFVDTKYQKQGKVIPRCCGKTPSHTK